MTSPTNPSLRIVYTAPDSPDRGQDTARVELGGPPLNIVAVGPSELSIDHPPGQQLRLASPPLIAESVEDKLVVQLPAAEHPLDLICLAVPSQAAIRVVITTKKESSKPELPRRATF